ncbi:MAG TPA: HAMP domain-containing sensor histidine kinase [Myxococcota bacterium]|jgi:signal transduction histidine kinase
MTFLLSAASMRALPVALVDLASTIYLLQVWRRSPSKDPFGALPLALFFAALTSLAFGGALTASLVDMRASFLANHLVQSVSVLLSAPAIVAFSYRFLGRSLVKEQRLVVPAALLLSLGTCAFFVYGALTTPDSAIFYDFATEHARRAQVPFEGLLGAVMLASYGTALAVLVRKSFGLRGRQRASARAFAVVIVIAIGGVVVNRLESESGVLPIGTYTTYMMWLTVAGFLLFVTHTDEITRFPERIAALVLVSVLGATAVAAQRTVAHTDAISAAARHDMAQALVDGRLPLGSHPLRPATASDKSGDIIGSSVDDAVIIEVVDHVAVSFPYVDARRAAAEVAFPCAIVMVVSTLLVMLLIPRLAELSVLRQLRRLERADADSRAKSVFLAAMSHELRAPIAAILHHARALADQREPASETKRRTSIVMVAAEQMLALMDPLLLAGSSDPDAGSASASMTSSLRLEDVDVGPLVQDAVDLHRESARQKNLPLHIELGDDIAARVDRRALRQIVSNLVGNAVKHTSAGTIAIRAKRSGRRVVVEVQDSGPGIPPHLREQVFLPFFQVAPTDGAGLGLSIARQLADAMGGSIALDTVERGARFVVDLEGVDVPAPHAATPVAGFSMARVQSALANGALRDELLSLARMGDIVTLQQRTSELARDDDTRDLAGEIAARLQTFQVRSIRRLLGDAS